MKKGIDISYWQESIDFGRVKKDVDFVILREGYRNTIDARFLEYVQGCKDNGIKIHSVYHFVYATNAVEAREEARTAIEHVKKAGLPMDTRIWCDVEYDTVEKAKAKGITLGTLEVNLLTMEFCKEIEKHGYKTGIYCNTDYYKNYYTKATLSAYPIWLADYSGYADYPCMVHQYGSNGKVSGINGTVDMNYCYCDECTEEDVRIEETPKLTKEQAVKNLIDEATSWEGYCEKASNDYLESFTANAGPGNYTIFGKIMHDLLPAVMDFPAPWCDCFVDFCFQKVFGVNIAKKLLCGEFDDYTVYSAKYYKDHGRYFQKGEPGDQIFFRNDSGICHTGIVCAIDGNWVYTIEGNSSNKVRSRAYRPNDPTIDGYGRPDWDVVVGVIPSNQTMTQSVVDIQTGVKIVSTIMNLPQIQYGNTGIAVSMLQTMLGVEITGVFDKETRKALKKYQKSVNLEADGICGKNTWNAVSEHMCLFTK